MTEPQASPTGSVEQLDAALGLVVEGFSGVIRVIVDGGIVHESAHGWADRAHQVPMTVATRIGVASGAKTFTALSVLALVEQGVLSLATTARSLLGADLPLIDAAVTIEHLLAHRSGIGDYFDEEQFDDITDYAMPVPVHRLDCPEAYLAVLDGFPMTGTPGAEFRYNNGGFVLLALLAERAAGRSYYDLVDELVCRPAGLTATAFLRSDELPGDAAVGYLHLDGPRTNLLHLPVRGGGDGGIATTATDITTLWEALFSGQVIGDALRADMTRPRSTDSYGDRYGLGLWIDPTATAFRMEGYDAGASFRSFHSPEGWVTWAVLSNTSEGTWPVARALAGWCPTAAEAVSTAE